MKKIFLALLICTLLLFASWGEDSEKTLALNEIIDYALEHNPELEDTAYKLRTARENLMGTITIEDSTLTGKGNWESDPAGTADPISGSLSLNVPFTDQVSLSGSWDLSDSGSAGITIKPLNLTTTAASSRTALLKAEIELNYLSAALSETVSLGVLNFLKAELDYNLQKEEALLAQKQYDAGYAQYLESEITYQDLQDLNDKLTNAQRQEIEDEIALTNKRSTLLLMLGPEADFLPETVTNGILYAMIEKQKTRIIETSGQSASSQTLETTIADYDLLKTELSKTLAFQPDLSISAGASFSSGTKPYFEASLSISVSPETFDPTDRNQLKEEVKLQLRDFQLEEFKLQIEIESARDKINAAEKEVALANTDIERQQVIYNEAKLLVVHGERTALEVEDARLTLAASELNLSSALISVYQAQADYLALFP